MNKKKNIDLPEGKSLRQGLSLLDHLNLKWVSSAFWEVDYRWRLPRRTLQDVFLFLPLDGHLQVGADGKTFELAPGSLWWVDEDCPHEGHFRSGSPDLRVLAFHLHLEHRAGGRYTLSPPSGVFKLNEAWVHRLRRLVWLDQEAGDSKASFLRHEMLSLWLVLLTYRALEMTPPGEMDPRIWELIRWLEKQTSSLPTLEDCSRQIGLSKVHLRNLFSKQMGQNPHDYILGQRMAWAKERILGDPASIAKIAQDLGFASPQQFHRAFKKAYGTTPAKMRQGQPSNI